MPSVGEALGPGERCLLLAGAFRSQGGRLQAGMVR